MPMKRHTEKKLANHRAQKLSKCCSTARSSCEKAGSTEWTPAQKDWRWWMWIQALPPRPAAALGLLEAVPGIKGSQSRGARGWMAALASSEPSCLFHNQGLLRGAKLQGHSKSMFSPRGREGRADRGRDCVCYQEITCCLGSLSHSFLGTEDRFSRTLGKTRTSRGSYFWSYLDSDGVGRGEQHQSYTLPSIRALSSCPIPTSPQLNLLFDKSRLLLFISELQKQLNPDRTQKDREVQMDWWNKGNKNTLAVCLWPTTHITLFPQEPEITPLTALLWYNSPVNHLLKPSPSHLKNISADLYHFITHLRCSSP